MLVYFTMLPTIFLSGFFFPLAAMPPLLRAVSYVIPLRHYLIIIRSILLKGVGAGALTGEIAALAIFGAAMLTAAALRFRKRPTGRRWMHLDKIRRVAPIGLRRPGRRRTDLPDGGLGRIRPLQASGTVEAVQVRSPGGFRSGRGGPDDEGDPVRRAM
jgi:hypothetical protein